VADQTSNREDAVTFALTCNRLAGVECAGRQGVKDRWLPVRLVPKRWTGLLLVLGIWPVPAVVAQTCQTAADLDPATRTAIETTAKHYFDMAARGESAALRQNTIPALAGSFGGIESAVKDNQTAFSGAAVTIRPPYVLTADGDGPISHAEFLCGVFGKTGQTSNSSVFVLHNLPPGKYATVILDVKSSPPRNLTLMLQQVGTDWKLAGFFAKPTQIAGHDAAWFAQQARAFKAKGETRNAWLYFHQAISLTSPVDFMSTLATDKLYDEAQAVQSADLPANGQTADLAAGGKTYQLTTIFALAVGDDLDLVVKYQAADVSNTGQTFQENIAVIKALVAKFPEFRDAFSGVVARAVEPSGRDYGSMLPMKEIK